MDDLLDHLEKRKEMHSNSTVLQTSLELAWSKLNKYYTLADVNPILYASVVLHPSMKYDYFDIMWKDRPSWISHARKCVTDLWHSDYKSRVASSLTSRPSSATAVPQSRAGAAQVAAVQALNSWKLERGTSNVQTRDELQEYLSSPSFETETPHEWWIERRAQYPKLSVMALNVLAVPAMSAEVERVFSSCGLTITPLRSSLSAESLEAVECLSAWDKKGVVTSALRYTSAI
jgi:hypothetical protein